MIFHMRILKYTSRRKQNRLSESYLNFISRLSLRLSLHYASLGKSLILSNRQIVVKIKSGVKYMKPSRVSDGFGFIFSLKKLTRGHMLV